MFRKLAMAAVAVSVLATAGSAAATTDLLTNGDFEDGLAPDQFGSGLNAYSRGIPTGWLQMPGRDNVDTIEDGYSQGGPPFQVLQGAQSGTHFLDMNGFYSNGGIYQDVTGIADGAALTLSLWSTQWVQNTINGRITYNIRDLSGGHALLATGTVYVAGTPWTLSTLNAVANSSGGVRIELLGDTDYQAGPGLDNVSLTARGGGVVPEPATWGLMIAGFGGIGAMLRRRRPTQALA